jgi:hypothetical protein
LDVEAKVGGTMEYFSAIISKDVEAFITTMLGYCIPGVNIQIH